MLCGNCQPWLRAIKAMAVTRAHPQAGAAILAAMLTVALVAIFAANAMWQQYRSIEVETAERARVQAALLSTAALDWARLVLSEDARAGAADHLAEPWTALFDGVQLSSFLAADKSANDKSVADKSVADNDLNAATNSSLTGQIMDLQSRLNVTNLIDKEALSAPDVKSFTRLFELLGLPVSELTGMANQLLNTSAADPDANATSAALPPQRVEHLVWLGLSGPTLAALRPHITLLPQRTPVNLNTASAEVIYASTAALPLGDARKLVELRNANPFRTLADTAGKLGDVDKPGAVGNVGDVGGTPGPFSEGRHDVASSYFEVRTRLKLNQTWLAERAIVQRDGTSVRVISRDRGAAAATQPAAPARTQAQSTTKMP